MTKDINILVDLKMTLSLRGATNEHIEYILTNINNIIGNLDEHLREEIKTCGVTTENFDIIDDDTECPQFAYLTTDSKIDKICHHRFGI